MNPRRRAVAALAAATAIALPRALGQRPPRKVGYLSNGADASWLVTRLIALGHAEGRTFRVEYRVSPDRAKVEAVAAELVAARPDVIVAFGAHSVGSLAARTRTIPIVCGGTADPVGTGYARTLRKPGGNITGLSYGVPEMAEVMVGLMRKVRPEARRVKAIVARDSREDTVQAWGRVMRSLVDAAGAAGIAWEWAPVATLDELKLAVAPLEPANAMVYFISRPEGVDEAAAAAVVNRLRLVSFSGAASQARAGALMHYSIDHADPQGRVAAMVDQILRGAHPADMPFELPDRTTFILNRATAKSIGLILPPELLARATEIVGVTTPS